MPVIQRWVMKDGALELEEIVVPEEDETRPMPVRRLARNDSDNDKGKTHNVLNTRWDMPLVDAHCHIMGQGLLNDDEQDDRGDPRYVTFINTATGEKFTMSPAVLLLKKKSGGGPDVQGMLDAARNSPLAETAKQAVQGALTLVEQALAEARQFAGDAAAAMAKMRDAVLSACESALNAALESGRGAAKAVADAVAAARTAVQGAWDSIKGQIASAVGALHGQIEATLASLKGLLDSLADQLAGVLSGLKDGLRSAVAAAVDAVRAAWDAAVSALDNAIAKAQELRDHLSEWVNSQADSLRSQIERLIDDVQRLVDRAVELVDRAWQTAKDEAAELSDTIGRLAADAKERAAGLIQPVLDGADKLAGYCADVASAVGDAADSLEQSAVNAYNAARGQIDSSVDTMRKAAKSAKASVDSAIDELRAKADAARQKLEERAAEIKASIQSARDKLEELAATAKSMIDAAQNAAEKATAAAGSEAGQTAQAAAELGMSAITGKLDKVFGGGIVELPAADWPPQTGVKTVGSRVFPTVSISSAAKVSSYGVAAGSPVLRGGSWLLDEVSQPMLRFVTYMMAPEEGNARVAIDGVPRMGGRCVIPYLLDMGYTPLSLPIPFIGTLVTAVMGLPDPKGDDDGYYKADDEYIWFDRTLLGHAIDSQKHAAESHPYQVWPMVPFDPRRPDALDLVKQAIADKLHVGVKLYSRCGWMPTGNDLIYGAKGYTLDRRLEALYSYCEAEDIPLVNHTSPGGYPPEGLLTLPALYDSGTMYHNRTLFPGKVGAGPLPLGILDFIPDEVTDLLNGIPKASPSELKDQAAALQSDLLDKVGGMAQQAKETGTKFFDDIHASYEKARQQGAGMVEKLQGLLDPSNLADPAKHAEIAEYIDPARLGEIAEQYSPSEIVRTLREVADDQHAQLRKLLDPAAVIDGASGALQKTAQAAAEVAAKALDLLFQTACRLLAMLACYRAAKYCHYVQHTVSPYAWEDVLREHTKLRLNFAHCTGEASVAAHYGMGLTLEEAEATGDDEKIKHAKILKDVVHDLHANPFVADGASFRERMFAHCAKQHVGSILFQWGGTGEDAIDPAKSATDLVSQALSSILPAVFGRLLRKFNLTTLRDGTREAVDWVLATDPWKEWLEDWESTYPDGWHAKMLELVKKYDNVYTDLAYLSGDSTDAFDLLLRSIALDAYPDDATLDPMWSGVMLAGSHDVKEGTLADKCMMGTDWYMTERDDLTASSFWERLMGVVGADHPLFSRWASRNAITWINLGPRMDTLEERYAQSEAAPDEHPRWWLAMRHLYGLEFETGTEAAAGGSNSGGSAKSGTSSKSSSAKKSSASTKGKTPAKA